jgi:hypothetical protein
MLTLSTTETRKEAISDVQFAPQEAGSHNPDWFVNTVKSYQNYAGGTHSLLFHAEAKRNASLSENITKAGRSL